MEKYLIVTCDFIGRRLVPPLLHIHENEILPVELPTVRIGLTKESTVVADNAILLYFRG